ncbi:hypothetical protein H9P43_000516 [Blastocladiella emersonii ATCC 22665]|nr:hypothetical protein H9P43_000516 [Blastocladiella emersonii ATCC 22665]
MTDRNENMETDGDANASELDLVSDVSDMTRKVNIGSLAIWSTSSSKAGSDLEGLMSEDIETFWQSEGALPHTIMLRFPRPVLVCQVSLLLSHPLDDSFTPEIVMLRAGFSVHGLEDLREEVFQYPDGWVHLSAWIDPQTPVQCTVLQICIHSNHNNGLDSHVRGLKVFGPRPSIATAAHVVRASTSVSAASNSRQPLPVTDEDVRRSMMLR